MPQTDFVFHRNDTESSGLSNSYDAGFHPPPITLKPFIPAADTPQQPDAPLSTIDLLDIRKTINLLVCNPGSSGTWI